MKSERAVTKLQVFCSKQTTLNLIMPILKKFGGTIKYLSLFLITSPFGSEMSDIVDILLMIPHVEHLDLAHVHGTVNQPPEKRRRLDDLNLNHLKKLRCDQCSDDILSLFNRLPHGVLIELDISIRCADFGKWDQLFKRQTNIRKLTLHNWDFMKSRSQVEVAVDSLDHLHLETFDWQQNQFNFNIAAILSHQPKLKSLRLDDIVDVNVMNIVNGLSDLESLTINLAATPSRSIVGINKLKNLKHLAVEYLHNSDIVLFDTITKLDNSRIRSMDIAHFTNITPAQYRALAISAPKLTFLQCFYDRSTFGTVMKNFNFLECLRFLSYGTHDVVIDPNDNYFDDSCVNLKLIELSIGFQMQSETQFLKKLVADVPNLKRLMIKSKTPITTAQFQLVLSGFPRLESLSIHNGASELTQSDFDYLQVYKNNLKFISLNDLDPTFIEIKEKFQGVFDVVQVKHGYLTAAADTQTIIRERDQQSKINY